MTLPSVGVEIIGVGNSPFIKLNINGWVVIELSAPFICWNDKVNFFEVSAYTKDAFKESLQKDLNYGYVSALAINSLNGFT